MGPCVYFRLDSLSLKWGFSSEFYIWIHVCLLPVRLVDSDILSGSLIFANLVICMMTRMLGYISSIKLSVNSQDVFLPHTCISALAFLCFPDSCELGEAGLSLSLALQHQGLALLL